MPACERHSIRVLSMLDSDGEVGTAGSCLARASAISSQAFGERKRQNARPMVDGDIDCAFRDAFGIMRTCLLGSPKFCQGLEAMRNCIPICRVIHLSVGKFSDGFRRQTLRSASKTRSSTFPADLS